MKDPEKILYKYKNLCETNDPIIFKEKIDAKYLNLNEIENRIEKGLDVIGRDEKYLKIDIDSRFPDYILDNKSELKKWIIN